MEQEYAHIFSRVKALVIDSVIIILLMYLTTEILAMFKNVPDYVRVVLALFIFILYEPLFVSLFGGTIGHAKIGITVKKENNPQKNINFFSAIIRFVVKSLLGWISLLTISGNEKRKAIHDFAVGSVVLIEEENK